MEDWNRKSGNDGRKFGLGVLTGALGHSFCYLWHGMGLESVFPIYETGIIHQREYCV